MPCLHDSALLPPSSILHHQHHNEPSKVTEHLRPDKYNKEQEHEQKRECERPYLGYHGKASQQRSQRHRKYGPGSIGIIKPLVRLVREPVKTLGELYSESNWDFENGKRLEQTRKRELETLYSKLKQATSYDDWYYAAAELDRIDENDRWKLEDASPDYNSSLVLTRLKQLNDARSSGDIKRILFLIRTSLARGLGGMGNLQLYQHSHVGTKRLIEDYISSAKETLATLLQLTTFHTSRSDAPDPRYVLEQLLAARQAFGRSALLLSGGGTFGLNHIGVVKSLWQAQLLPRIISGSSAGSIVCAVLCTKTDEEIPEMLEEFAWGDMSVFNDNDEELSVSKLIARFLKFGSFFDIANLVRVMKRLLGDLTFQEAYNRTRRILNICVSSAGLYELPRLLNYVTSPNVLIWSAVATSCSVPIIFSASSLMAKDPKTGYEVPWNATPQRWIDGSVDNDIPITRLAELFNVNHFIVSQVNPHVVPFLGKEHGTVPSLDNNTQTTTLANEGWMNRMADLAKGEVLHRLHVLSELGVFPTCFTKIRSVLSQRYSGDITILPEVSYMRLPNVLSNPTSEFMIEATLAGERATWPQLSRIQNRCALELALDDAVRHLRARVVFSPSQVDLRLSTMSSARGIKNKEDRLRQRRPGIERGRSAGAGRDSAAAIPAILTTMTPEATDSNQSLSRSESRRSLHRPSTRRQLSWLSLSARRPRRLSATAASASGDIRLTSSSVGVTPGAHPPPSFTLQEPPSPSCKLSNSEVLSMPLNSSRHLAETPSSSSPVSPLSTLKTSKKFKGKSYIGSFTGHFNYVNDDDGYESNTETNFDRDFDDNDDDDHEIIQITQASAFRKRKKIKGEKHCGRDVDDDYDEYTSNNGNEVIAHVRLNSSDQSPPPSVVELNSSDEAEGTFQGRT